MASLGRTDLDVFPICLGGNVFGWTADEAQSHAVLDAYIGRRRQLHRHRQLLPRRARALGDDHRPLAGRPRQPRPDRRWRRRSAAARARSAACSRTRSSARRRPRWSACRPTASTSTTRTSTTRTRRWRTRCARSTSSCSAGKVRHIGASNYSPERLTDALELQRRARAGRVHRAAAALQPRRARVRAHAAAGRGRVGAGRAALLRAGQGLPDRQVPAGRRRGRVPARRGRAAPT